MLHIAILDTYVKVPNERTNTQKIFQYKVRRNKIVKNRRIYKRKIINHGTICYTILNEYTRGKEYALHCIEVIPPKVKIGNINNLKVALEWCLKNDIQIISMSVGTRNEMDGEKLRSVVKQLYEKGVIMIAAFNNQNTVTYPATYESVIGVCCGSEDVLPPDSYICLKNDIRNVDIIARCNIPFIEGKMGIRLGEYNSFMVPYIVSVIVNIFIRENNISSKNIRKYLEKYATKQ